MVTTYPAVKKQHTQDNIALFRFQIKMSIEFHVSLHWEGRRLPCSSQKACTSTILLKNWHLGVSWTTWFLNTLHWHVWLSQYPSCQKCLRKLKSMNCIQYLKYLYVCYAITTNSWTSRADDSYVSLMLHVLREDFKLWNSVITCRHPNDEHSAKDLTLPDIFIEE